MKKFLDRLAIIPARGGSKRITQKNIRNFCGSPIINYSIRAAVNSNIFQKIHVSSEDDEIIRISEELGIKCEFKRPKNLADDYTPIVPVLKFVVDKYKRMDILFKEVWMLMPCSPFITANILKEASDIFREHNTSKTLISVCEYPVPIEWSFKRDNISNKLEPVYPGMFAKRSQDIAASFHDTGSFMAFSGSYFDQEKVQGSDRGLVGFKVPRLTSIDIDTEEDWHLAELIYKAKQAEQIP